MLQSFLQATNNEEHSSSLLSSEREPLMGIAIIAANSLDELRARLLEHAAAPAATIEIQCALGDDLVVGWLEDLDRFVDFRLVRVDPLAPAALAAIAAAALNARDTYRERDAVHRLERLRNGSPIVVKADDAVAWTDAVVDAVHAARCINDSEGNPIDTNDLASLEG